jgi:uroporphyrinogen decarboxylase
MYKDSRAWNLLMTKLTDIIIIYLQTQVRSGVQALQLFDSWVGYLSEQDYKEFVVPYTKKIFATLKEDNVPLIHFGTNTAGMLKTFASVNCDVVGVDWRIPLDKAWEEIGYDKAIQGNLDPALLLGDFKLIKKRVYEMFGSLPKKEGYIFNLGHGVLQNTPVETLVRLTDYVHNKR